MKFFPDLKTIVPAPPRSHVFRRRTTIVSASLITACALGTIAWQARAVLPRWMQDAVGGSAIEAALYRAMEIPGVKMLYPRPPKEAQGELTTLIGKSPGQTELYSLRAMEEEQALDFRAAEADWKTYVARAKDSVGAKLELADYYHRRLQANDEVRLLMEVGSSPAAPREEYVPAADQRSWKAFERLLTLADEQGLPSETAEKAYVAWITRYPQQPSLYARELRWMLDQSGDKQNLTKADTLVDQYRKAFPHDAVFPLKASALIAYRRGSTEKALATYDAGFEPLWPADLVSSYYSLLGQTHQLRRFVSDARDRLVKNPDDLNAMARLFYYAQQQGNLAQAQQVIDSYRQSKETRKAAWSAQDLYTLATLTDQTHAYPEAARYDFALYNIKGQISTGESPQATGLGNIIRILLTTPDQPVALGAGNLSMYRDLATLDHGPGYWNGILSLWLNSTSPGSAFHDEEQRAQPYFHRAKAAELLGILDKNYPEATQRAGLHKELIRVYAEYGESTLVVKAGSQFLHDFPSPAHESDRIAVAMYVADAYARQRDTRDEFALYDQLLTELGGMTAGMPLTAAQASSQGAELARPAPAPDSAQPDATASDEDNGAQAKPIEKSPAFEIEAEKPTGVSVAGSSEYREILERYLGRLTATKQLPQALAVLRHELDRNPNDPLLYERLASFLEQNRLGAQQEEVYQQAIQKFQDRSWYDKLARLYLREKKRQAFAALTKQVTDIFSGTELEAYFHQASINDAQMYLELNLYAHQRFPHDEIFVRNLLHAYQAKGTRDDDAWAKLLREHWSDAEAFLREFFDYLNRTGKLDAELTGLRALAATDEETVANPAAARELAEAEMWRSHFEASAPLFNSLADSYPSDSEIGTEGSSLDRSLAYYDASQTAKAVTIEKRLLAYDPSNLDRLARIGDIYSDSGADGTRGHENLAAAAPYWRRMPEVHPGTTDGYLQAATVFWDYFQFDDALVQIRAVRERFHKPALYGYEAGAILEGKREFDGAIHEYTVAALDQSESEAAIRLMQLARRKATAKAVDEETAKLLTGNTVDPAALLLRARVLEVQRRNGDIGPMLEAALSKSTTFEQAQSIGAQAQTRTLPKIYEQSLQKEISLARDPQEKLELSYDLMRAYEARNDTDDAARVVDSVYHDNPKLLGVVRNTADFYWRTKQSSKAITTLTEAASASSSAQPALSRQFIVEAADKANQSGNYSQARELMASLIDPARYPDGAYNAQYLAVVAESYARAGDDAGLKKFYLDKLDALRGSMLPVNERKEKTVLLRRGLIPALTRMKDYAGAVDQYISILSAYPEDAGTVQEAALYALRYNLKKQLVDFASQTVKASPRDSRFSILLAQVDTTFEDYPSAIDAYAHAISIRADRSDIFAARAALEERLQRLNDACKDYERLYVLSYQDPQWMLKEASVRARQGRKEDAVKALERAWIEGHPATAHDYFEVATQLESWQMLDDAMRFAEEGRKAEGDALLAGPAPGEQGHDDPQGAAIYARLMTRLRQRDRALNVLDGAMDAVTHSPNAPGVIFDQIQKHGIASVSNDEWRKRYVEERVSTARQRYRSAVVEIGKAAGTYFTPEEKQSFVQTVSSRFDKAQWQQSDASDKLLWVDVASASGLSEEEARLRKAILFDSAPSHAEAASAQFDLWAKLERSRMNYTELARTAAAYAKTLNPDQAQPVYAVAADAYRDAGDEANELRMLEYFTNVDAVRDRVLALLYKLHPDEFVAYGKGSEKQEEAYGAANYAITKADLKLTRAALSARIPDESAPWLPAYSALTGLYFSDVSDETENSFHSVLADGRTIGQRLSEGRNVSATAISGDVWFYYGMRYGVYRTLAPKAQWQKNDPEDLLPAELERNASAANYALLAGAYGDAGETDAALSEYAHAIELAPNAAEVHDAMALLLWDSQRKDEARAQWREAFAALNRVQNSGAAPERFWTEFSLLAQHVAHRKVFADVRPEMETLLRNYIGRNGDYRCEELLHAAFTAIGGGTDGATRIISLSSSAREPASILSSVEDAAWLTPAAQEPVFLRALELARAAASQSANNTPDWRLAQAQHKLLEFYVLQRQDAKAEEILASLTRQQRSEGYNFTAGVELAARGHRLNAFLADLDNDENSEDQTTSAASTTPTGAYQVSRRYEMLRNAAGQLDSEGDKAGARTVWEYVFAQLELTHNLSASDFAGLARARLLDNDLAGSITVLRRMVLHGSENDPDGTTTSNDAAARLLELNSHEAEAIEFLTALVKEQPWNATYNIRLTRAQLNAGHDRESAYAALQSIAANRSDSYDARIQAVVLLRGTNRPADDFGSKELSLLEAGKVTAQQARQPYYAASRIAAADATADTSERGKLLREAIAIAPQGIHDQEGFAGPDLRLKLFRAEAAQGSDVTALAALQTILQPGAPDAAMPASGETADTAESSESPVDTADEGVDSSANEPNPTADSISYEDLREGLTPQTESLAALKAQVPLPGSGTRTDTEKLALSLVIVQVYKHTGNDVLALPYLKLAAALESDKSRAGELNDGWRSIEIALALQAENHQRQPLIQKELEQADIVRPRITMAPTGTPAAAVEAR